MTQELCTGKAKFTYACALFREMNEMFAVNHDY